MYTQPVRSDNCSCYIRRWNEILPHVGTFVRYRYTEEVEKVALVSFLEGYLGGNSRQRGRRIERRRIAEVAVERMKS